MAPTRNKSFSGPTLATRIAVTLAALAIYRVGVALPLPGVEAAGLRGAFAARTSIFALGVIPLLNALLFVEIARLLSKRFNDRGSANPAYARRINQAALIGSLLLAAVQAFGVALGLERISGIVDDPGPEFRLGVVTTLVGGTALLAWLAALISRHGVGSGFWILLLTPWLADLPAAIARQMEFMRMGVLTPTGAVSILAYALIAVAVVTALGLVLTRRGMPLERTLIWPLYIGAIPANVLAVILLPLPDGPLQDAAGAFLSPGGPLYIVALAVSIIAVSLAQSRRAEPFLPTKRLLDVFAPDGSAAQDTSATPDDPAGAAPVVLTAAALAAIAVAPYILTTRLGVPIPVDGNIITAAAGITLGLRSLLPGHRA